MDWRFGCSIVINRAMEYPLDHTVELEQHKPDHDSVQEGENGFHSSGSGENNKSIQRNAKLTTPSTTLCKHVGYKNQPQEMGSQTKYLAQLQEAVGLLAAWLAVWEISKGIYAFFCTEIHRWVQEHVHWIMMYQEELELNVDRSAKFTYPLSLTILSGKINTFHFQYTMQQHGREEFINAMVKELWDHYKNNYWRLVK